MNAGVLTIHTQERGARLGDLFGIFFEDLNHAADGGLYAELVQNRSFEFAPIDRPDYHALTAWEKVERGGGRAIVTVESNQPLHERNPHYAVIQIEKAGDGVGIMNLGYHPGMPIRQGETYRFSCYARRDDCFAEPVRVALEGADGRILGQAEILVDSGDWRRYEARITAESGDVGGRLVILTGGEGRLYLDMVSLFPGRTFRGRENGLREDIAEMLAALKPKFMRFPGGCLVHDGTLNAEDRNSMYRWKNTIGPVEQRPPRRNNWGYNQTLGLGFYEYFLFCEDIGAKPIPVLPAGYDPHHQRIVPLDELQPWIEDALDLIEFANGDVTTRWGAVRAELGHPEPFGLEYIAIGNEEVGEPFFERYAIIHRAIRERYPEIRIINTSGPFPAGGEYERGWRSARENGSDYVDEHYYVSPEWMLAHIDRYDHFPADGPKVFLGEYATWGNTYYNALVEAAYMTRLERNAHAVGLACYAPLLCNVNYVNWRPNLIWFNNHQVYGTPNYYVQKLFMHHQGDQLLRVTASGIGERMKAPARPITGKIALAADRNRVEYRDVLLVNERTGEVRRLSEGAITLSDAEVDHRAGKAVAMAELAETDWEHYSLRLMARKLDGPRGFILHVGRRDDRNSIYWELGGWQNQDSTVCSRVNGRGSCLTQHLFTVEEGREYELAIEIQGRRIRVSADGNLIAETEDRLPSIEPLYYTASMEEETGDVLIKAVNLQDQPVTVQLELDGLSDEARTVEIHEMSGYELDQENSFEEPEAVVPKSRETAIDGSRFGHEFPARSFTVLRVRQRA
jgi:alpha-L-arabinofuranosidase